MNEIKIDKVDGEVVRAALRAVQIEPPKDLAACVKALAKHFKRVTPKARLADCTICGGISDVNLPACPYCGDADTEGVVPAVEIVARPAVTTPADSLPHGVAELNDAVARVVELKRDAALNVWELAQQMVKLSETGLWKLRKDEDGHPRYRTWGLFCNAELGMSASHAYRLCDVAKNFTRQQVEAIGTTKLQLALKVPPEKRGDLIRAAEAGATVAQIAAQVSASTESEGPTRGGKRQENVTVAALLGRVEIPLFKSRTASMRAKSIGEIPRGEERMLNSVKQTFVVTRDEGSGELLLVIERVRE